MADAKKAPGVTAEALQLRQVAALEGIGASLARLVELHEAGGVPGSAFERFLRAADCVASLDGALLVFMRAQRFLGPTEEPVALERIGRIAAGLVGLKPDVDPVTWFAALVTKAQENARAEYKARGAAAVAAKVSK